MNDTIVNHNNTSYSVDNSQKAEYRNKNDRNQTKFRHLCETGIEMWWMMPKNGISRHDEFDIQNSDSKTKPMSKERL